MHQGVGFLQIIDSFTCVYIIYYGHAIVFFVRLVIPSEIIASLHTNFVQLSIVIEWCQILSEPMLTYHQQSPLDWYSIVFHF